MTRSTGCVVNINDNDKVTQVNEQSTDQEVHKNNDAGHGAVLFTPTIQVSRQTAVNYNSDKDVFIVLGCNHDGIDVNDNDKVTQVNEQSTDQEVHKNNDAGHGAVLFTPTIQVSRQTAVNHD
jgi:hypothetical protein